MGGGGATAVKGTVVTHYTPPLLSAASKHMDATHAHPHKYTHAHHTHTHITHIPDTHTQAHCRRRILCRVRVLTGVAAPNEILAKTSR